MKTKTPLAHVNLLLMVVGLTAANAQSNAFTYQGHLTDGGSPASGLYDLRLVLLASESGGPPVGLPETNSLAAVPVINGMFTVALDFGAAAFTGPARWLEIGVRTNGSSGDFTTLAPCQPVTPTPYALFAGTAATLAANASQTFTGTMGFNPATPGAPPFAVTSAVKVHNLNADLFDGLDSTNFLLKSDDCLATIAELKARAAGFVSCVTVLGYYAPGDGGGGNFYWDASSNQAANSGTVFVPDSNPTTGRWNRLVSGTLSVRWFGATADDAIDDSLAIRAAIRAARALPNGGTIFFPAGTYAVTSILEVNTTPPIALQLKGEGYASVIRITGVEEGIVADYVWNLEISNLRLEGAVSRMIHIGGHPGTNGPLFIRNNFVSGATLAPSLGAIAGISIANVTDAWITGNLVTGNGRADTAGYGLGYDIVGDASGNGSSRVHVRNNTVTGAHTAYGIVLFHASSSDIQGNVVDGGGIKNRLPPTDPVDDYSGYGITFYSNPPTTNNVVSGNHVRNTAGTGIYLQSSPYSIVMGNVLENVCLDQDDQRLVVAAIAANAGPSSITGNIVRNSGRSGIGIQGANHTVSANTIESCRTDGIQLNGSCTDIVLTGNAIQSAQSGIRTCCTNTVTGVSITGNTVSGCTWDGVSLISADDGVITGNRIHRAGNHLIIIQSGSRNLIEGNRCSTTSFDAGIDVHANHTLVANNLVDGCFRGISEQGSFNTLLNNTVIGNTDAAILASGSSLVRSGNRLTAAAPAGVAPLTTGTVTVHTSEVRSGDPCFSPDGSTFFFVTLGRLSSPGATGDIWQVPVMTLPFSISRLQTSDVHAGRPRGSRRTVATDLA